MISEILINGHSSDGKVPITDSSVLRGDGCFEVLKAYDGTPFAVEEHIDRLARSAAALRIPLPDRRLIAGWIHEVSAGLGDSAIRVLVTRGPAVPGASGDPMVIVFAHDPPHYEGPARLYPLPAPWHPAGESWDLMGAKTLCSWAETGRCSRDRRSRSPG
jgi:branched-chain amino acid aminotransferase